MGQKERLSIKWFPDAGKPADADEWQAIVNGIVAYGFVDLVREGDTWRVTLATTEGSSQVSPVKDLRAEVVAALSAASKPVK